MRCVTFWFNQTPAEKHETQRRPHDVYDIPLVTDTPLTQHYIDAHGKPHGAPTTNMPCYNGHTTSSGRLANGPHHVALVRSGQ